MTETPRTPSQQQTAGRRARRHVRRRIAATALLLLALTALPWGGTIAHAHASLVESSPADGAIVTSGPETLQLTFNEDVTLLETTRLRGPGGETPYTADVDGGLVTLRPGQTLTDGRWDLVWQIVSADGHLIGGVLTFTVGTNAAADELLDETPDATAYTTDDPAATRTPGALDRVLELLGWIALIGALGSLLVARHAPAAWLGAGAVLLPALRIVDSVDRWRTSAWIVGETRAALAAALAGALLLTTAILHGRTRKVRTGLATLGVLTWSAQAFLSGHPNVLEPEPLYAALSALHLAGALTWSAAVLAVLLAPARARTASRVATGGIALLLPGASLLVAAFLPGAVEHGAGRWEGILAAKAAIVLGALGLGWRNHRTCRCPRCRRHGCSCPIEPDTRRRLRRHAGIEVVLIALVAVLSASLTASVPARVLYAGSADTEAVTTTGAPDTDDENDTAGTSVPAGASTTEETTADDTGEPRTANVTLLFENGETGELLLETRPDGTATIHLVLRQADGTPFTAEQVEYELENQELGITGLGGNLPVSGGMHMGETDLPGGGTWRISVRATYDTFTTITATAEIHTPDIGPGSAPRTGTKE